MKIHIGQSKFIFLLSIAVFLSCFAFLTRNILKFFLLGMVDDFIWENILGTFSVLGILVSIDLFFLSFWIYEIDEDRIIIINKLSKSRHYLLWSNLKFACYNVDYRGGITLIVSPEPLDYKKKSRILHRLYMDPLLYKDVFWLRINPYSEDGVKMCDFIKKMYGVTAPQFHRI